jgi:hypothetical protein
MFGIMSELKFFLLARVMTQDFNTMELIKIYEKNQKLHIWIVVVTLKVTSCKTISQKKKVEKSEKSRFYGQNNLLSKHHAFQPLGSFSHMAICGSSLENTRKMSLIPVLNKTSPWADMKSRLDVLGVPGKFVKYVVHLSERKKLKKNKNSSHKLPRLQSTSFLVSRNFRG